MSTRRTCGAAAVAVGNRDGLLCLRELGRAAPPAAAEYLEAAGVAAATGVAGAAAAASGEEVEVASAPSGRGGKPVTVVRTVG